MKAVARKFDETALGAAIDRALELLEEERQTAPERRRATEEALRAVRNEEARLTDAVKQGRQLDALLAALQAAQDRRRMLEAQLAAMDGGAVQRIADPRRIRAELSRRSHQQWWPQRDTFELT